MEDLIEAKKMKKAIAKDVVSLLAEHKLSVGEAMAILDHAKIAINNSALVVSFD